MYICPLIRHLSIKRLKFMSHKQNLASLNGLGEFKSGMDNFGHILTVLALWHILADLGNLWHLDVRGRLKTQWTTFGKF